MRKPNIVITQIVTVNIINIEFLLQINNDIIGSNSNNENNIFIAVICPILKMLIDNNTAVPMNKHFCNSTIFFLRERNSNNKNTKELKANK